MRGLLDGFPAAFGAGGDGFAEVEAFLGAEADVDGLPDEVGDHGLDGGDGRFLHRFDDGLHQRVFERVEDASYGEAGDLGGGHAGCGGQAEGDDGGGGRCGDLDGQGDELDDDRVLGELHQVGSRFEGVCDDVGGFGGVGEVAVRAVGELLVVRGELLDGLARVVRDHRPGTGVRPYAQLLDVVTERPPQLGGISEQVLVRRRPVVAEHLQNPLELIRQHHRHSAPHPR
ncbi:hypothetical protein [Streptomyces agglomeratus]|uniref:hypothetical protein n=1 Tax=Streptomyces agglomeratus TaxID=285458 RepID=UPI00114C9609|nr:hypothetical protein [Streptomyces agglomeratus]